MQEKIYVFVESVFIEHLCANIGGPVMNKNITELTSRAYIYITIKKYGKWYEEINKVKLMNGW